MENSIKLVIYLWVIASMAACSVSQLNTSTDGSLIASDSNSSSDVRVVRDEYGVPHIFGARDLDAAFGLAYAHAEDDFKTIQQGYLAGNNQLSKSIGNKGLGADFIAQFIGSEALYDERYESEINDVYKKVLDGYKQGINSYADSHPEELLVKDFFPITIKKMIRYAQQADRAVAEGADELDVVMNYRAMLAGDFKGVRDDLVRVVRAVRGRALLPVVR